ncbi:MAG: hypothetical protein RBU21_13140 [FCB group bacterium]|jgi:hypothetical protein|nr:hypothetical protein [FCB group bacterium]
MRWIGAILLAFGIEGMAFAAPTVTVQAEEAVYQIIPPNNGSGPLWSFGCSPIARLGQDVIVAQMETGEGVPRLCNTRWRLLRRTDKGWEVINEAEGYRQREPALLGVLDETSLLLNVNDSIMPPGTEYGPCKPYVMKFTLAEPKATVPLMPTWVGEPHFTDHSYRGFAVDSERHELLMLNIDATTSVENWCWMNAAGETLRNGGISFPIRSCYPQVALKNGAAYVLAISDIVEPVKEWAEFKFDQTKQKWDYVFRILYFTYTPDIKTQDFVAPIEIANVDATAGAISNQDLWIAADGSAHILYTQREVQTALLRDKFFPGRSILPSLHLAVVKDGKIVERKTLHTGVEGEEAGWARFHETPSGSVYALVSFSGNKPRNELVRVYPAPETFEFIPVPLKAPFGSYLLPNTRAGNKPSNSIDLIGNADGSEAISYAQLTIQE